MNFKNNIIFKQGKIDMIEVKCGGLNIKKSCEFFISQMVPMFYFCVLNLCNLSYALLIYLLIILVRFKSVFFLNITTRKS